MSYQQRLTDVIIFHPDLSLFGRNETNLRSAEPLGTTDLHHYPRGCFIRSEPSGLCEDQDLEKLLAVCDKALTLKRTTCTSMVIAKTELDAS